MQKECRWDYLWRIEGIISWEYYVKEKYSTLVWCSYKKNNNRNRGYKHHSNLLGFNIEEMNGKERKKEKGGGGWGWGWQRSQTWGTNDGGDPVIEVIALGASGAVGRRVVVEVKHLPLNPPYRCRHRGGGYPWIRWCWRARRWSSSSSSSTSSSSSSWYHHLFSLLSSPPTNMQVQQHSPAPHISHCIVNNSLLTESHRITHTHTISFDIYSLINSVFGYGFL